MPNQSSGGKKGKAKNSRLASNTNFNAKYNKAHHSEMVQSHGGTHPPLPIAPFKHDLFRMAVGGGGASGSSLRNSSNLDPFTNGSLSVRCDPFEGGDFRPWSSYLCPTVDEVDEQFNRIQLDSFIMNMFDKSSTKKDVDQKKRKQTNGSLTQKANGSMIIELENDGNQVETNGNNETIIEDKPDEDDEESTQKLRQEIAKLRQLNFHLYQSSMDKLMNESVHKFDAL